MRYPSGPGRNVDRALHEGDQIAGSTVLVVLFGQGRPLRDTREFTQFVARISSP